MFYYKIPKDVIKSCENTVTLLMRVPGISNQVIPRYDTRAKKMPCLLTTLNSHPPTILIAPESTIKHRPIIWNGIKSVLLSIVNSRKC